MNNQEDALSALTDQPITINLGGKSYTVRKATLYDLGVMEQYQRKLAKEGSDIEPQLAVALYMLTELMKPHHNLTPKELGLSIPMDAYESVIDALEQVGFKKPQRENKPKESPTGA